MIKRKCKTFVDNTDHLYVGLPSVEFEFLRVNSRLLYLISDVFNVILGKKKKTLGRENEQLGGLNRILIFVFERFGILVVLWFHVCFMV